MATSWMEEDWAWERVVRVVKVVKEEEVEQPSLSCCC